MTFSAFTTVAGNGKAGYSGDGRPASEGQFSEPHDVVVDTDVEISTSPTAATTASVRSRKRE
jgi:hypothetical protein